MALSYGAVAAVLVCLICVVGGGAGDWSSADAERFHAMADVILEGFTPYVDFVDPKPPLLFFAVSLMDWIAPAGSIDTAAMAVLNVAAALLICRIGQEDYGAIAGFAAGLLYLVTAAFVQGYFLLSEQFAVLCLLGSFLAARRSLYHASGLMLGLAVGFKQYAALAAVPLFYLMYARGEGRYGRLVLPAAGVVAAVFGAIFLVYGAEAGFGALFWTFGVAPGYLLGDLPGTVPDYQTGSPIALAAYLLASVVVVLPALLFAAASVGRRGLRTAEERTLGIFVVVFLATLLVRQYLHYWLLLLPFLALLACREFADEDSRTGLGDG